MERLHNPLQLRICVLIVGRGGGLFRRLRALEWQNQRDHKKLQRDRKMLELAGSIEQLQKQFRQFDSRVPQQADSKEWVQYVLEGIRHFP